MRPRNPTDQAISGFARRHAADLLVAAVVLAAAAPTVQLLMAHQASRLAFTAAVWDDRTLQVDAYGPGLLEGKGARESGGILQVDFAIRDGHLYSDKAPGQPFLAVPFYAAARAVGAQPGIEVRYFNNLTLWWTSLWSAAIPAALLAVLMRRFSLRVTGDPRASAVAAVGMSLATLLLPFATVLFSHVLAGLLAYLCYVLAEPHDASPRRLALAGLSGGVAVLTEYAAAIVVVVVAVLLLRRRWTHLIPYASGGLPTIAALGLYNTIAWGDPLSFSYDHSGGFGSFHEQGVYGINLPDLWLTAEILLGERGLLTMTPVVLMGVIGLVLLVRRTGDPPPTSVMAAVDTSSPGRSATARQAGVVGLIVFAAFVCVQGGWFSVTAGASPGPRYVVAALPFLAVGVARAHQTYPRLVIASIVLGGLIMFASITTNPLAQPRPFENVAAGHWFLRIIQGRLGDNLLTPYLGKPWGHIVQYAVVGVLVAALHRSVSGGPESSRTSAPSVS